MGASVLRSVKQRRFLSMTLVDNLSTAMRFSQDPHHGMEPANLQPEKENEGNLRREKEESAKF